MGRLRPAATTPPGYDVCTIRAGGRQCFRARTTDLEGATCSHARVAWFYGGSCTPAGSQAVVTLHWRCTGYFFRGIPSKELTSEGPAHHSPRRRCKTLVTPLGHTTQGAVLARCGTGSRSGSPAPTRARTANQWIFRAGEMGFWRLISSITSCTHSHAAYCISYLSSTPAVYEAREVPEIRYRAFRPRVGCVAVFHKTTITLNFVQ